MSCDSDQWCLVMPKSRWFKLIEKSTRRLQAALHRFMICYEGNAGVARMGIRIDWKLAGFRWVPWRNLTRVRRRSHWEADWSPKRRCHKDFLLSCDIFANLHLLKKKTNAWQDPWKKREHPWETQCVLSKYHKSSSCIFLGGSLSRPRDEDVRNEEGFIQLYTPLTKFWCNKRHIESWHFRQFVYNTWSLWIHNLQSFW